MGGGKDSHYDPLGEESTITSCERGGWTKLILKELNRNPGESLPTHADSSFPFSIIMSKKKSFLSMPNTILDF